MTHTADNTDGWLCACGHTTTWHRDGWVRCLRDDCTCRRFKVQHARPASSSSVGGTTTSSEEQA